MTRRWQRAILRAVGRAERPAAWCLLIGALITFLGTAIGLLAHGEVKWATLLVAADLLVSGWTELRDVEGDQ